MAPQLERVFTIRAFLDKDSSVHMGATKGSGHRLIGVITGGFIQGSGLDMEILPGGADWLLLDTSTGTAHLDIRLQARDKTTGASLYAHYPGIMKIDAAIQKCFEWSPEAKTTESKDHYFFATPVFEVSAEEMKWMERTVFVSHGHWVVPGDGRQAVEYEVYKVVSA